MSAGWVGVLRAVVVSCTVRTGENDPSSLNLTARSVTKSYGSAIMSTFGEWALKKLGGETLPGKKKETKTCFTPRTGSESESTRVVLNWNTHPECIQPETSNYHHARTVSVLAPTACGAAHSRERAGRGGTARALHLHAWVGGSRQQLAATAAGRSCRARFEPASGEAAARCGGTCTRARSRS